MARLNGWFVKQSSAIYSILLPVLIILITAYKVIFSGDGLLENIRVREKILSYQSQTEIILEKSSKIRHQIYVLKLHEEQMIYSTSSQHFAAPQDSQIYIFNK